MTRTLRGGILRLHVAVIVSTCVLLVAGAMAAAAFLLQSDQRSSLRSIADAACHGIASEQEILGGSFEAAAHVFLEESAMEGVRVELFDAGGDLLASGGPLKPWPETGAMRAGADGCATRSVANPGGRLINYACCTRSCGDRYAVQAIARDVLDKHDVRRAAAALLLLLPVAVLVGALAGRAGIARQLRPLLVLRGAVARIDPNRAQSLNVGAKPEELATLEQAFDVLLRRLGETIERERRFTQEASHELRTPLTVLRARLERLADGTRKEADIAAEAGLALRDLDSIDRLIEALLVLARSDSEGFPMQPVNLCDLARDVAQVQTATDGPGCPPPEVEAPDEILVLGNEELLSRALANVVENARKYGGPTARIRIRTTASGERGELTVDDSGPGIDPSLRPLVFDRFSRGPGSRSRVRGSGLGLAVVRAIVERHRGTVVTGPSEFGGESVRLTLPLLDRG